MSLSPALSVAAGVVAAAALAVPLGVVPTPAPFASHSAAAVSAAVVPAPAVSPVSIRASRAAQRLALSERIIGEASKYAGTPYVFGGTTPRGFDCSGYTRRVYAALGKHLPRTSQQQFNRATPVKHPRVGDLIFYHAGRNNGPVYHVGIYAGPGHVWHAPHPGDRVRMGKIYSSHWTAGRF